MTLQTKIPPHANPPPLIRISGTHARWGARLAKPAASRSSTASRVEEKLLSDAYNHLELTWEGARIRARKYMLVAQELLIPSTAEKLAGIAEGANVSIDDGSVSMS